MPLLVGKKVRHTFNEGNYIGRVISTVQGFPAFYNIVYDSDLDKNGDVTENTVIYTYKLLEDYKDKNLEIIPEVVSRQIDVGSLVSINIVLNIEIIACVCYI